MSVSKLTMKTLPAEERPYEKLERMGAASLSDAELLAVLLRNGTREERVTEMTRRMLAEMDRQSEKSPLTALFCLSLQNLKEIPGIGRVKAIQLKAMLELSVRLSSAEARSRLQAENAESLAAVYMETMRYLKQETVKLIFLDNRNRYIAEQDIAVGSVNQAFFSPRDIFTAAVENHAVHLIILHNHPSGDPTPSPADIRATRRLIECGELLDIQVLDHIVIGQGTFYSMREHEILTGGFK